jgi:hypothetical protein
MDNLLYYHYKWLVLDDNPSSVNATFKELPALPSSEIFLFQRSNDGYQIIQIYRTCMRSSIIEELFGMWFHYNRTILDLRTIKITSRRRQNLQKSLLKASMVVTNNDTLHHLMDYQLRILIYNF